MKHRIPVDDKTMAEITKQLVEAKAKTEKFFRRYGFECDMNGPANLAFTNVVETEHANGNNVDFPMARKMFMLGYMKGHDSFPMKKNCELFQDLDADGG